MLAQLTSESGNSDEQMVSEEREQSGLDLPMNESGSGHRSPNDQQATNIKIEGENKAVSAEKD